MRNLAAILVLAAGCSLTACSMFTAWKSIPPPGGCNECHTVEISANWKVLYQPVALSDERGSLPFQHPQYVMPGRPDQPRSSLEVQKVSDSRCYDCHNAPDQAHRKYTGRYHHGR